MPLNQPEVIISHKHRFIFIKTNKTAGTSVEISLSRFCGPDDIITPISPADEVTRKNLGYRGPQNHTSGSGDDTQFFNHISAAGIMAKLPNAQWDEYFKFCIERNPWDRVISLYWWLYPNEPRPTISEFVGSDEILRLKTMGIDLYTQGGKVVVNRICKFENLKSELDLVMQQLGMEELTDLPRSKSHLRKDRRSYRDILGDEERRKIEDVFSEEISLMGYTW